MSDKIMYQKLKTANDKEHFPPLLDEFRSTSMEESFRNWSYPHDRLLIRSYCILTFIVITMFIIVDLALNELSIQLYPILAEEFFYCQYSQSFSN